MYFTLSLHHNTVSTTTYIMLTVGFMPQFNTIPIVLHYVMVHFLLGCPKM